MIFYFTGTGNSLQVAKSISASQNETLISVAECIKKNQFEFTISDNETIGFVFPVYFFGTPTIIEDFICKLKINNYKPDTYTFTIMTCGGSSADSMNIFKSFLKKKSFHLNSGFNIVMPDNYIILFNLLPPEEKRKELLKLAIPQIERANEVITKRQKNIYILEKGSFPRFMSFTLHPVYTRGRSTKPFHYTPDCNGCGICALNCPLSIIHMKNKVPVWKDGKCTQCLACLHRCPKKAVQYGKKTYNRGRYVNPVLSGTKTV